MEEELLRIVTAYKDYTQVLQQDDRWPILYHLSDVRKNILEWYPFQSDAELLEIGAECGALTGLFCERVKKVTAVEVSDPYMEINGARNRDRDNLQLRTGVPEEKFDYVTLIGTLERAQDYVSSDHPCQELLGISRKCLKPGGTLILAVDNKYALQYYAGMKKDHLTFAKTEMEEMLKTVGFEEVFFYYPIPEYRFPLEVYSEAYLPQKGSIKTRTPAYREERMELLDEVKEFNAICEDGVFPQYANSYLVMCR